MNDNEQNHMNPTNETPSMTPPTQVDQSSQPVSEPAVEASEHKKVGPIVGSLIIVVLLVAAALYILNQRLNDETSSGAQESRMMMVTDESQDVNGTAGTNAAVDTYDGTLPPPPASSEEAQMEAELDAELQSLDSLDF